MGVAAGDMALLRRGLESWELVAKLTLEQITAIAMKVSNSINSILRFFKLPVQSSVSSPTKILRNLQPVDFNLCSG